MDVGQVTPVDLLPVVLALPLLGVIVLTFGGRFLSDRVSAILASGLVGLSFVLALVVAAAYWSADGGQRGDLADDAAHGREPIVLVLWSWIDAGDNLVAGTFTRLPLAQGKPIPEAAVIAAPIELSEDVATQLLPNQWDPQAVLAEVPIGADLAPGTPLTKYNVPPGPSGFVPATPRTQIGFQADVSLMLDGLSLVMLLVVTGVGFLIHVFAIGYMSGDPAVRRFFTYLNLFVFSMLLLVLAADFLVLFVGWELVGLCSYLLIGFWFNDTANASAGRKAFIVNRVGDFAFLLGLMLIWSVFGSLAYADVFGAAEVLVPIGSPLAIAIALLLLIGATGKSAQLPLHLWLPDAMAGPTPVSALIHAATMVTAGVYMIARAHVLFELAPQVMALVAIVGATTAFLAAIVAVVQIDIKRVLAFSTISQLGFMFLAVGAGAYIAAVFHLAMHAFFKALLFLGAGSLMHGVAHGFEHGGEEPEAVDGVPPDQDMRLMGGLLRGMPVTGTTFLIGGLALAGLFPLAGFWSKDEILLETLAHDHGAFGFWTVLYIVALVTAFLTAFYAGRQLLLVLAGDPRSEGAKRAEESPHTMTVPLIGLALLTIVGGLVGLSIGGDAPLVSALEPVVGEHQAEAAVGKLTLALVATAVALGGLGLAWITYGPRRVIDAARVTRAVPWAYRLAWNAFYVDEVYTVLFVRPFRWGARFLWIVVDDGLVDSAVNVVGRATMGLGQASRRLQTGYVRTYLLAMLMGAALLAAYMLLWVR